MTEPEDSSDTAAPTASASRQWASDLLQVLPDLEQLRRSFTKAARFASQAGQQLTSGGARAGLSIW